MRIHIPIYPITIQQRIKDHKLVMHHYSSLNRVYNQVITSLHTLDFMNHMLNIPPLHGSRMRHMPWLDAQPKLNQQNIDDMTQIYRDRLASTLQIDVAIEEIYNVLQKYNALDDTYIIYWSDHGYHLGQYRIPCEKDQMFDTDIRIPYYIRGPGITAQSNVDFIVGNVDVMPTVLDLANIAIPDTVDGKSFKSKILNPNRDEPVDNWRDMFLIEFISVADQYFNACTTWHPTPNDFHGVNIKPSPYTSNGELVRVNYGAAVRSYPGNNYRAIRIINTTHDVAYAEYINYTFTETDKQNPYLYVLYDLNTDPYQLKNIYAQANEEIQKELHDKLMKYGNCQGKTCP
eukprot:135648_1